MSDHAALPRPRQVTLAGWLIMAGSLLVVVTVFERIAGLNSLETRNAVEQFLAEPPGEGSGLDTEAVLSALRVMAMIAGACAAAAAILGFHVLKRSRGARIGVTVLAAPLFVTGLVAGGFLSSLVAAAAILLWLEPSRDWFAGRPARTPEEPRRQAEPERPRRVDPPPPPPLSEPRAHEGFGSVPVAGAAPPGPAPYASSWSGAQPPVVPPSPPGRRPGAVLWACLLTWVFAGLAALVMALSVLVLLATPDLVFDELNRQNPELADEGLSESTMTTITYVTAAVVIVWSALATTLAVLLFRRVRWARVGLMACTGAAGAVCLLAAFQSFLVVLPLLACAVTFSLLLRPDVRRWVTAP